MKIREIKQIVEINYYVQVDDTDFSTFRRSEHGIWENLMGESWEPVYSSQEDELERQFQLEWFGNVKDFSQEPQNTKNLSG